MMYSVDYLGGAKYAKVILANHPSIFGAGIFARVDGFGDGIPVAEALAKKGVPRIRIHCMWKDNHDFKRTDFPAIVKEAKRVEVLARKYPAVEFRVSGACEHKLDRVTAQDLASVCKKAAPSCIYVNTPMTGGAILVGEVNEIHGKINAPKDIPRMDFSFDGTSAVDSDVTTYKKNYRNAETFYFWIPQLNGRRTTTDTTPRPSRKAYPTKEVLRMVYALAEDEGATSLPSKYLYKSASEQTNHDTAADTRGNRPVIIIPQKADFVDFVTPSGKVVARAKYFGTFKNQYRYYCPMFGYQITKLSQLCHLRVGNKVLGLVNPSFRAGRFK